MISKCPLSVLERCPPYREFGYGQMTEKRQGPSPGVRLMEVSVLSKQQNPILYADRSDRQNRQVCPVQRLRFSPIAATGV